MTLRSLLPPPSQKITDGGANCHLTPPILQFYLQLLSFISPVCVPYELYDTPTTTTEKLLLFVSVLHDRHIPPGSRTGLMMLFLAEELIPEFNVKSRSVKRGGRLKLLLKTSQLFGAREDVALVNLRKRKLRDNNNKDEKNHHLQMTATQAQMAAALAARVLEYYVDAC
eukprot:scaffold5497_cov135-Cylindrotheca_fusiformis.AAC.1